MEDETKETEEEKSDETPEEDKTSDEDEKKNEEEAANKEVKKPSSKDYQKIHWRNRARDSEKAVEELKAELEKLKASMHTPTNEQEKRAQDYIREQARSVFQELQTAKKKAEDAAVRELKEKMDIALEDNPDITEEELLEVVEELEVEPDVALKIMRRQEKINKSKPKMPAPKRATPKPTPEKHDDKEKSLWQIAQEEAEKVRNQE
ncbi:MAG: hypothetical protein VKN72_04735 [Nostocales cyanobacterium 94392]|nr:hypothetical protein [Nostocales cyanobacterium 94392]